VSGDEIIAARSGSDPWSGVDSAAIRSIAGKTTSQLAASLPRGGGASSVAAVSDGGPSPTASASPASAVSPKSAGVLVQPVSGAPGDGQRSLTIALKKRLYAGGVKLANGPAVNVYMVKGSVKLADSSGGKQSIRIDWQVIDPSGKKLGTVSQQNISQGGRSTAHGAPSPTPPPAPPQPASSSSSPSRVDAHPQAFSSPHEFTAGVSACYKPPWRGERTGLPAQARG
jgi:hypothetical protein